jgi:predicted permease
MMETLRQDIRYAVRQLWRAPAFTVAALATLALGIGANTALFTLGQAMLLRPLAGVLQSDQLFWLTGARGPSRFPTNFSYPDFLDYRDGLRDVADISVTSFNQFSVSGGAGEPERVHGEIVSGNYFSLLRTPFALGRGFVAGEDSVGNPRNVVVLSYGIWQRRFSGDPDILGRHVVVNGMPLTVVGVATQGFNGPDLELPRDVYVPVAQASIAWGTDASALTNRGAWWLRAVGRLHPGVTRDRAESVARTVASRIAAADTVGHKFMSARTYSAKSGLPAGSDREVLPLTALASIVTGLVLLIACSNVSNLLLARAVSRRREVAIRLSIGASRTRIVRQLFSESLMLAAIAAAIGVLLAYVSTDWLVTSGVLPLQLDLTPDRGVIGFAVIAAALASVLFGLVPAFDATRGDIAAAVKGGGNGRDPRRARLQNGFVVTQLALSLVLLTTSGLFLRSMYKARGVDVGFEATSQVVAVSFDLGLQRYSDVAANAFLQELTDRTTAMPGVERVSFTDVPPMGERYVGGELMVEGAARGAESRELESRGTPVFQATIRPQYFATIDLPIVRGRDFTASDDKGAPPVAIVGEQLARTLWPGQDPIGKRVSAEGDTGPWLTVVGVAREVLLGGPTEARRSVVYLPQRQHPDTKMLTLLARTRSDPAALTAGLRRTLRQMDADLPLFNVRTLAEYKRLKLADRMNGVTILAGFGALALLLASIGVYGVMAFSVIQRTREIGIRIALGARGRQVVSLFIGRAMRLTLLAVVIGVSLSLALSRLLQGMLFGLTPTDVATFAGVAALLSAVAVLASWIPARRAARVDPISALRYE